MIISIQFLSKVLLDPPITCEGPRCNPESGITIFHGAPWDRKRNVDHVDGRALLNYELSLITNGIRLQDGSKQDINKIGSYGNYCAWPLLWWIIDQKFIELKATSRTVLLCGGRFKETFFKDFRMRLTEPWTMPGGGDDISKSYNIIISDIN